MGGFEYFGEREGVRQQRTVDAIDQAFWGGIVAAVDARLNDGSFAEDFPLQCPEYPVTVASNLDSFGQALRAEHHNIAWPLDAAHAPNTLAVVEAVEFFHLQSRKSPTVGRGTIITDTIISGRSTDRMADASSGNSSTVSFGVTNLHTRSPKTVRYSELSKAHSARFFPQAHSIPAMLS